jgi:hypothetical protein
MIRKSTHQLHSTQCSQPVTTTVCISQWSTQQILHDRPTHSSYNDLPRISKTATRTKPKRRVSCPSFRQLPGPPSCDQSFPHLPTDRSSFKAPPVPFPSSHMSAITPHLYSSHTAQFLRHTTWTSGLNSSRKYRSLTGHCPQRTVTKFHKYRIIPYPVQGYQLPKHWQTACYSSSQSWQSRDPLPRLVTPEYPKQQRGHRAQKACN